MKRFTEQFHKESKKIRLQASERADLRDRLTTYMEYHPLPVAMRTEKTTPSQAVHGSSLLAAIKVHVDAAFLRSFVPAMLLFIVVAVPILAEETNPGDVLYPVKIRFNEEVRSKLANSPYEEIEWESTRIERRIAEARLLASEGKLTTELEAEVAAAVKEQTEKTKTKIAELKTTDADEGAIAEIALASALEVQNEVLEADAVKNDTVNGGSGSVLASVVAKESSAATAQQAQSKPSYEKLLARLEVESTNAQELFESIRPGANEEEVIDVQRRLADVSRKVLLAQKVKLNEAVTPVTTQSLSESSTEEVAIAATAPALVEVSSEEADEKAAELLREALADVRKLISFMTNIDVRQSVSVDELVPVTFTDEERHATIEEEVSAAEEVLSEYKIISETVPEDGDMAVAAGSLSKLILNIREQLTNGALTEAEKNFAELATLKNDLASLLAAKATNSEDSTNEGETATTTDGTVIPGTEDSDRSALEAVE